MASPVVANQSPANGATDVARAMPIYLEITDADADLVAASVIIKVNNKVAWTGDAAQPGFAVTKTGITNGFSYSIVPVGGLPVDGNTLVYSYADDGTNTVEDWLEFGVGYKIYVLESDHFTDSSVGLTTSPGNGVITEPAGTELKLDCPNSANCDWWQSVDNAPRAYFLVRDWMRDSRTGVFRLEARLSDYATTVANVGAGITLFADAQNAWHWWWYDPGDYLLVARLVANVGSNRYNSAGVVAPSTTPHRYLIIYNVGGRTANIDDPVVGHQQLLADEFAFFASVDDGASWVKYYSEILPDIVPLGAGVFLKKWDAGVGANAQAYFDYLEFSEILPAEKVELSDTPIFPDSEQSPGPKALLEDVSSIGDAGGPPAHHTGSGAGQLIPGPVNQSVGTIGPLPKELVEDSARLTDQEGRGPRHQLPASGEGLPIIAGQRDVQPKELVEDRVVQATLGNDTNYNKNTTDGDGHFHFTGDRVIKAFLYDTAGELWTTPTDPSFSGYGQDGHEYVAGVLQGGGPHASWATEASSVNRSNRDDFPDKVLVCYVADGNDFTPKEVVIFDLDSYPTQLYVWMRFTFAPSSTYTMMGRVQQKPASIWMGNGVLVVGTVEGDYRGGLHIVDFKATGQDCFHHIRSDDHFKWNAANGIVNRNVQTSFSTSVSPELRINPEDIYSVHGLADGTSTWVAIGGEDTPVQVLRIDDSVPTVMFQGSGAQGEDSAGNTRHVLFDSDGWFWFTADGFLYRGLKDFREGVIFAPPDDLAGRGYKNRVQLPSEPWAMAQSRNFIYLATDLGVYRVDKGSLAIASAYTIAGGGGGGKDDNPPDGELVGGTRAALRHLATQDVSSTGYVATASYFTGSATLIRLLDEYVVDARVYPDLDMPGCWFNIIVAE